MPRKITDNRRTERLEARVSAQQKETFLQAAALRGQTLTDFIISAANDAAKQTLRQQGIVELTRRDQIAFAEALQNPPQPVEKLQLAAQEYRKRVSQ